MKQISVTIETFRDPESQFLLTGSKKTVILQDSVNTTELLLAEIKSQTGVKKMTSEKLFINGKEASGAIELDKVHDIRFEGYVKENSSNKETTPRTDSRSSRFESLKSKKEQFLASKNI